MNIKKQHVALVGAAVFAVAAGSYAVSQTTAKRTWLPGDSHIHSIYSPGYNREKNPPEPIVGGEQGDAQYPTEVNAAKAKEYGLQWMVTTDHGGPNHSRLNLTQAYPALQASRTKVPEVLQFYGMEFNGPAMDHHMLMLPNTVDEWKVLFNIESQFDKVESFPVDVTRDTEANFTKALIYMNGLSKKPIMMAHHPARSATDMGVWGVDEPREFRDNNDTAPEVYVGFEGAPGHQAAAFKTDGTLKKPEEQTAGRGAYSNAKAPTMGGFDQMTAVVGGLWDSLLSEGRHFWISATSDSHLNWRDTLRGNNGIDFWPGEYSKTYVKATKSYDDILDGMRNGRTFVTHGDLINELEVTATAAGSSAEIGGTLGINGTQDVTVTIRFKDPSSNNARGQNPSVKRVDLIVGEVKGLIANRNAGKTETTKVFKRFTDAEFKQDGEYTVVTTTLPAVKANQYLRVRGTNMTEEEPTPDVKGEDPYSDLWFYANPIFVEVK
jgi:hypothetical protein